MSLEVTRDEVISYFIGAWADTDIALDNIKYDPTGASYVRVSVFPNISSQPCLGRDSGETWERDIGDIILGVFVPVDGDIDGLAMAEKARRTLSQKRFGGTLTGVGYTVPAGISEDKRYYLHNVRIEYMTDNIKQEV
jgi:hypothetical protein